MKQKKNSMSTTDINWIKLDIKLNLFKKVSLRIFFVNFLFPFFLILCTVHYNQTELGKHNVKIVTAYAIFRWIVVINLTELKANTYIIPSLLPAADHLAPRELKSRIQLKYSLCRVTERRQITPYGPYVLYERYAFVCIKTQFTP